MTETNEVMQAPQTSEATSTPQSSDNILTSTLNKTVENKQPEKIDKAPETKQVSENKPWYDGVSEEDIIYLKAKGLHVDGGYKNLLNSYKSLEKLRGVPEDKLIKIPDNADNENWNKVYDRLGRPESPDKYDFTPPKDANIDSETLGWFNQKAHSLGLNKKQHNELVKDFLSMQNQKLEHINNLVEQQKTSAMEKLKQEWGNAFDDRAYLAEQGLKHFLDSPEDEEAVRVMQNVLGYAETVKFFAKIGQQAQESQMPIAEGDKEFGLGPKQYQEKLQVLMKQVQFDKDRLNLFNKNQGADRKEYNRLMELAYGQPK